MRRFISSCDCHVTACACRNKPHGDLQSEITSLRNIISQYKRSLKSLDDEVELHKLNQKEHDKRINVEKQ